MTLDDSMAIDPSNIIIPAVQAIITLLKQATSLLNPIINDDDKVSKIYRVSQKKLSLGNKLFLTLRGISLI